MVDTVKVFAPLLNVKTETSIGLPSAFTTSTISIAGQLTVLTDDYRAAMLKVSCKVSSSLIKYVKVLSADPSRIELVTEWDNIDPTQGSTILTSN